jgi:hypothetical protein
VGAVLAGGCSSNIAPLIPGGSAGGCDDGTGGAAETGLGGGCTVLVGSTPHISEPGSGGAPGAAADAARISRLIWVWSSVATWPLPSRDDIRGEPARSAP